MLVSCESQTANMQALFVRKKDGSLRLTVDYRKLNRRTIKDAYAVPRIDDAFSRLSGAKWFSLMDLKSGYYQVEMEPDDREKTAFVCPLGFFLIHQNASRINKCPCDMSTSYGEVHGRHEPTRSTGVSPRHDRIFIDPGRPRRELGPGIRSAPHVWPDVEPKSVLSSADRCPIYGTQSPKLGMVVILQRYTQ